MKKQSKKILAVFMMSALAITAVPVYTYAETAEEEAVEAIPVIEKSDVTIENGSVYDLTAETGAENVFAMKDSTVIIKYKSTGSGEYQSLFSVANSTQGNQDRHFHIYVTPSGNLGMELRNTDAEFKYTMSASGAVSPNKENIIAFKADSASGEYKLFANGKLVASLSEEEFKGFADISGADTISLGGTIRQGSVGYPFAGEVRDFRIYDTAVDDEILLDETDNTPVIPEGVVLEAENIEISEGSTYDLTDEPGGDVVQVLDEGTIVLSFTGTGQEAYQSLISAGNSTNGNQDRHFHLYITDTGALGMELRNTDGEFKYTLSRPAALRGSYKGEAAENTVALKADKENGEYKIFANGELLATLDQEDFKFIGDISGVDNVQLGGTIRQGKVAYPFSGTIHSVKVYSDVLSDEELQTVTSETIYGSDIFYAGDATGSNYYRIPTLLTLSSGTVIATADARYGGTHDAKSNIDIAFSKSTDNGETWSEATLPMVFDDYAPQAVEWPRDSVGKNVQIQGSASFIDSVTVEDSSTGRIFLFADAMPAGIGFSNTASGSGFKTVNGEKYVKLHWQDDPANVYNYTIREDGVIYDDRTNTPTEYSVDGEYDLMKNGEYLTQKQYEVHFEGSTLIEEKNDVDVNMNVFYKDSCFKVLPTNFIAMKYSDDEGETWSDMKLLGQFKEDNQRVPLYGPGVGTQIKNGPYAGRIILTMYNSISAEFGFLYSDDHGERWNYITTDLGGSGTFAEAQIVELPDGTLQTYMRTSVGKIGVITSIDGGMTWTEQEFVPGMTAASYGTQLSVINTSQLVDGKPAILLSEPAATNGRRGGKIWVGLVNDTGADGYEKYDIEWKYCYAVDNDKYGFAYSCMTELPDGEIGIYYEKYDSWSRNELHLKNIMKFEKYSLEELTADQWLIQ